MRQGAVHRGGDLPDLNAPISRVVAVGTGVRLRGREDRGAGGDNEGTASRWRHGASWKVPVGESGATLARCMW